MMRARCFSLGLFFAGLLVPEAAAAEEELFIALPTVRSIAPDESVTLPTNPVLLGLVTSDAPESDISVTLTSDGETRAVPFELTTATDWSGIQETLIRATPGDLQAGSYIIIAFDLSGVSRDAAYMVGEADDVTAPTFPSNEEMALARSDSDQPFWNPQFHVVESTAPIAEDDLGLSLYLLERRIDGEDFAAIAFVPALGVTAPMVWEDAVRKGEATSPTEQICYRWRALDLAGNEAALDESCVTVPASGCSQSSTSGAAVPFATLAGLLLSVRRRRQGSLRLRLG